MIWISRKLLQGNAFIRRTNDCMQDFFYTRKASRSKMTLINDTQPQLGEHKVLDFLSKDFSVANTKVNSET